MTTHDDNPWAPRDGEPPTPPTPRSSPIPDAPSAWAPEPTSPPTAPPTDVTRPPVPSPPAAENPVDRVVVGPMEAEPRSGAGAVARIVAACVAALLVAGGAVLAFGALTAEGGAETPEAAWEQARQALDDEDVVALAEIMEPSERETLFEAGFDFVDELTRLDVLDDDIDLSALEGIDLTLAGFEPRVERPGNGLAHIYLGTGTIAGEIDVAALPLGQLVLDRLDPEQAVFTDEGQETTDPTSTPLVAVERDGRWYLSLWYTVAENARRELDLPLPDPFDRPAAIGGPTPEAAVRLLFEEAVQLDIRRMIGALDPEEMAVLYDYAPLFLDDVEPATNSFLEEARASGWTWGFEDLAFTTETLDGGLARVALESFAFSAQSGGGSSFSLRVSTELLDLRVETVDEFFGDRFSMSVTIDGECLVIDMDDSVETVSERICGDELAESAGLAELDPGASLAELDQVGFVTREVDGVWYISPIRTGLDAMVTAVEQLEPETLAEFVDDALGLSDLALGGDLSLPGVDLGGDGLVDPGSAFEQIDPIQPTISLANDDLLAADLDPTFAFDLDPASAQAEFDFWAPALGPVGVSRGVYATIPSPSLNGGDVAVVSVELDGQDAADVIAFFAEAVGASVGTADDTLSVRWVDPFDDPIIVQGRGDRLHVFGVYGASADDLETVAAIQTTG